MRLLLFFLLISSYTGSIVSQTVYKSGQQAASEWVGISFKVPEGFQGAYDEQSKAFFMQDSKTKSITIGVYAFTNTSPIDIGEYMIASLLEQNIQVSEPQVEQLDASTLKATYAAYINYQQYSLIAYGRQYNTGTSVVVAALGTEAQKLDALTKNLLTGISASPNKGSQYAKMLGGKYLDANSHHSRHSSGNNAGSIVGSGKNNMTLCSNGSYEFIDKNTTYVSAAGMSMKTGSDDSHQGQWKLVCDMAGAFTIVLIDSQGNEYLWPIYETQNGVNVNGKDYSIMASNQCY